MITHSHIPDVRRLRKLRGFSQEELARRAEVSSSYVRHVEGGFRPKRSAPKFDRLLQILQGDGS
ncbi:MAG: helix-turn-helix transcriptional regulator [Actinomycetes bacterium]